MSLLPKNNCGAEKRGVMRGHSGGRVWRCLRWTHPVGVSVVDSGPFSAVVAEREEVGGDEVAPGRAEER